MGSTGKVYHAFDTFSGQDVAVKVIKDVDMNCYSVVKAYREVNIMHKLTK